MMKKINSICEIAEKRLVSVTWTHKINEKQADLYKKYNKYLNVTIIVLDALTTGGILGLLNGEYLIPKIILAVISTITLTMNGFKVFFSFEELINNYKKYANEFLVERNKLEKLLSKYKSKVINGSEFSKRFDEIDEELNSLFKDAPQTSDKAVKLACKALLEEKDNYVSKEELEAFIPESLRGK